MFVPTRFFNKQTLLLIALQFSWISIDVTHAQQVLQSNRNTTSSAATVSKSQPIDENQFVAINGVDQWISIRGADIHNPVILIVHGGPGSPVSYVTPAFSAWERHFTVVQWDQPGAGATFSKNGGVDGVGSLTIDRVANDAIAVTRHLQVRLGVKKVILLGHSWGTAVGLTAIQHAPDLYSAYVGTGQMVNRQRADSLSYEMTLAAARKRGDSEAVAELEKIGPPPYATAELRNLKQKHAAAPNTNDVAKNQALTKTMTTAYTSATAASWMWPKDLPPYNGRLAAESAAKQSFEEMNAFDARKLGSTFKVPMFFFQGELDAIAVTSLVHEYAAAITAPKKQIEIIPSAGHNTIPLYADEILALLETHVRPAVVKRSD